MSTQQGQVLWWVLVMTVTLSSLGVHMLNTSLVQWQLMQRSGEVVRALWLAEAELQAMELALRSDISAGLAAPPKLPLMPNLPVFIHSLLWQSYQFRAVQEGMTMGTRSVALGPTCLNPQVMCNRSVYHTVVIFNADGYRLIALRTQLQLQRIATDTLSLERVSWQWL